MTVTGEGSTDFTIRPPRWARWIAAAPLLFLAAAMVIAAMTFSGGPLGVALALGAVVTLALVTWWWTQWTAIRLRIADGRVHFAAPFYHASVAAGEIAKTKVVDDSALSRSGFDWVVMGRPRDRSGVRLNLGGVAALQLQTFDQRLYTVVFPTYEEAEQARRAIAQV